MTTGNKLLQTHLKKLVSREDFQEGLIDYFSTYLKEHLKTHYPTAGIFTGGALEASAVDTFDVDIASGDEIRTYDNEGRLMMPTTAMKTQIPFENENAINYHVGLKYVQLPDDPEVNTRTGEKQFSRLKDTVGEMDNPDSVVDDGDDTMTITVNSVTESGVDHSGRTCRVWLVDPESTTVYYEELTIQYSGGNNFIETTGALGQSVISTTASDYKVLVEGFSVKRNTDLSAESEYAYFGTVQGKGAGNQPDTFNISGQVRLAGIYEQAQNLEDKTGVDKDTAKTGTTPAYANEHYIANGDTLREAIGKIDQALQDAIMGTIDISELVNIEDKSGLDKETAKTPTTPAYAHENNVANGDTLLAAVDKIDNVVGDVDNLNKSSADIVTEVNAIETEVTNARSGEGSLDLRITRGFQRIHNPFKVNASDFEITDGDSPSNSVDVSGGVAMINGETITVAGDTQITGLANGFNYIYLKDDGDFEASTTGPVNDANRYEKLLIGKVEVDTGDVDEIWNNYTPDYLRQNAFPFQPASSVQDLYNGLTGYGGIMMYGFGWAEHVTYNTFDNQYNWRDRYVTIIATLFEESPGSKTQQEKDLFVLTNNSYAFLRTFTQTTGHPAIPPTNEFGIGSKYLEETSPCDLYIYPDTTDTTKNYTLRFRPNPTTGYLETYLMRDITLSDEIAFFVWIFATPKLNKLDLV